MEGKPGVRGGGAVDVGLDAVGAVCDGADELGVVFRGKGEDARSGNVKGAAGGHVVDFGYVKGDFN